MKKTLLTFAFIATLLGVNAQVTYENQLDNAYFSYANENWSDQDPENPIISFTQEYEGSELVIVLDTAGGAEDKGDRLFYAFTKVDGESTVVTTVDFSTPSNVTLRLKSDVAFTLQLEVQDVDNKWNDEYGKEKTVNVIGDGVYHEYVIAYEAVLNNYEPAPINMQEIHGLGFIFNNQTGGTPVSGILTLDWIKIDTIQEVVEPSEMEEIYSNELNDAYFSYAKDNWNDIDAENPIITFTQEYTGDELALGLDTAGGEGNNGDRFVYVFTEVHIEAGTVTKALDFATPSLVTMRIKSDVAFTLRVDLNDADGLWNDKYGKESSVSIIGDGEYHEYTFEYDTALVNYNDDELDMSQIAGLGLIFNNQTGGTAVTGTVTIDYIKVSIEVEEVVEVGFTDNSVVTQLSTYPNPASEKVTVTMKNEVSGVITLMTISGQPVLSESFTGSQVELSLNGVDAGQYILNVVSENGVYTSKVVKY